MLKEIVWEYDIEAEFVYKKKGFRYVVLWREGDSELADSVGGMMVQRGLARIEMKVMGNKMREELMEMQKEAKSDKLGLWDCDDNLSEEVEEEEEYIDYKD